MSSPNRPNKDYWQGQQVLYYETDQQVAIPRREECLEMILAFMPFAECDPIQVVDLGAGQGALALKVLERFPQAHVTLMDLSSEMLARARENLSAYAGRFTMIEADFNMSAWHQSLPSVIHAFLTNQALHYLETDQRLEFFKQLYDRLCAPGYFAHGGRFEVTSPMIRACAEKIHVQWVQQRVQEVEGRFISAEETRTLRIRHNNESGANRMSIPEHIRLLESVGFEHIDPVWRYADRAVIVGYKGNLFIRENAEPSLLFAGTLQRETLAAGPAVMAEGPFETKLPFLRSEIERSVPERFADVVRVYPTRIALKTDTVALTYQELDRYSNRIAHAVLNTIDDSQAPVALLVNQEIAPLAAIFGVLKAGRGYAALDPDWPPDKMMQILSDLRARLILTNHALQPVACDLAGGSMPVLNIETLDLRFSDEPVNIAITPDTPASIFYTSGSTGDPKGVLRNHQQILHSVWDESQTNRIVADDRQAFFWTYSFGISGTTLFSVLLNGAGLYPYNVSQAGIARLASWLVREEITLIHLPITLFRQFVGTLPPTQQFPAVRLLRLGGGQALYKHDVLAFKQHFPQRCVLAHGFATTETSRVAKNYLNSQTETLGSIVPVGYAVADKEIVILDDTGQPVDTNMVGEIAVRSCYLAAGYWNDPELTRQKFLPDPEGGDQRIYLTGDLGRMRPDGCLEYLGRKDFQVKIRGYRVVLTEIEAALYALDGVKEAVVVAQERPDGEKYLVAYLVPSITPAPTVSALRQALAKTLPGYMLPSRFVFLDALPLTPTGKVDRQNLPAPDSVRPPLATEFVAPRNAIETRLAQIFEEILDIRPIGVLDDFFALGGDSLSYFNIFTRIETTFGQRIPSATTLHTPTIEHIARLLGGDVALEDAVTEPTSLAEPRQTGRARRVITPMADALWPSPAMIRALLWLCGQRAAQQALFPSRIPVVQRFLAVTRIAAPPLRTMMQRSLACNLLNQYINRGKLNIYCSLPVLHASLNVSGLERFHQALQQGQGIILLSHHTLFNRLLGAALRQHTDAPVNKPIAGLSSGKPLDRPVQILEHTSQLQQARERLAQGELVWILPDGTEGEHIFPYAFYGRTRLFPSGFAELAAHSDAVVILARVFLELTGRFAIAFSEPFPRPAPGLRHAERVATLLAQYVEHLRRDWADMPWNIPWWMMKRHLALPEDGSNAL